MCWDSYAKKWCAYIGYYDYEADAAIAYDDRAIELYGEFACLNSQHRPEIKIWMQQTYLFVATQKKSAPAQVCEV